MHKFQFFGYIPIYGAYKLTLFIHKLLLKNGHIYKSLNIINQYIIKKEGLVLMQKNILNKFSFLRERLEESQILFVYRYVSLFITSTFYLLNHPEHLIERKIFIIGCLTISAVILSYLYLINEKSNKNIMFLLLIETIGNSILLIPSGGVNSPFIWYTLNTILISATFLKKRYCWLNLLAYLFTSSTIIYIGTDLDLDILKFITGESNLILSFLMITAAVQVWAIFVKKTKDKSKRLKEVNTQLESANSMIIESMDHIMTLYQSVNILTNQGNKDGLLKLLFEYTKKVTKSNTVFYYEISADISKITLDGDNEIAKSLEKNISMDLKNILEYKMPMEILLSDTRFKIMPVKSTYKDYGVLGFEATNSEESIIYKNNMQQLQFLSELVSIAFERFNLEEINERLLITEEQNRIANEIHDSVLQRLFSMSCGIFSLMKGLDKYSSEELSEELNLIRRTTDTVMKELRAKIYGLSWKKSGSSSFAMDIRKYIDDIKKLSNVIIPFSIVGNDEVLSCKQKKALYRMICEGIGNAIRHGEAEIIEVSLKIDSQSSILSIIDNGKGFDLNRVKASSTKGLGIQNLYQMTESLSGQIQIESKLGNGTKIEVVIPNYILSKEGKEAIV